MASLSGGTVVWNIDVDKSQLTSGLAAAKKEVQAAASDIDKEIRTATQSITASFERAKSASFAFAGGLTAIGVAAIGATGFGVKMAADIETARQGFITLLGSAEKADAAIAQIKKDATTTPFEFAGLVRANQLLSSVTKDANRSEGILLNVGKALAAAGKGGAELDNVIVNLQQIANTGKISEMDIRQFGFAGINILELLADQYGVTKEAAGDMVKDSTDAFGDLEKAFQKAGEGSGKFSRAFIDQAGTFNQLMSNLKDVFSQTAGDIVTSSGIFDAVKSALGGLIEALQRFQPQIISGISTFISFLQKNGPVVVGIIIGGLTPAFFALAASIGAAVIALAPFLLAGAAIGVLGKLVVDSLGGWEEAMKKVGEVMKFAGDIYNTFLRPALESLGALIRDQLLPALSSLWNALSPVLVPVLKVIALFLTGVLIGAFYLVVGAIQIVTYWIIDLTTKFTNLINFFKGLPDAIRNAFSRVSQAITQPFTDAYEKVRGIADSIKAQMDKISPFHRNSPSLIDKVQSGVGIIKDQFSSLKSLSFPQVSSAMPTLSNPMEQGRFSPPQEPATGKGSQGVTINIATANVRDDQDIEKIGREVAFRAAILPS